MNRIQVISGDITALRVTAIVNAANNTLCGGGGVDGAIHHAAGTGLLAECKTLGGCETSAAKITSSHNLQAEYVIHTVGPVWHGGHKNEPELLASCYRESLALAAAHSIDSIAFPAISCGVYRFPVRDACEIAVREVTAFCTQSNLPSTIFLVSFDATVECALQKALQQ